MNRSRIQTALILLMLSTSLVLGFQNCSSGSLPAAASNSSSASPAPTPTPAQTYMSFDSKLSSSYIDTCAIAADSSVACWGYNAYGQLGNGTTTDSYTPVAVHKADGSALLASRVVPSNYYANCAIQSSDKTVWCWGYNNYGQLGNGTTNNSRVAIQISNVGAVSDLQGGAGHFCAIDTNSIVWCWGRNDKGELGNGTTTNSSVPVGVLTATNIPLQGVDRLAVGLGTLASCAYNSQVGSPAIFCWGWNGYGGLGDGTTTQRTFAVQASITNMSGITQIVAMYSAFDSSNNPGYSCAVTNSASGYQVYCWGYNGFGTLGDGTTTNRTYPVLNTLIGTQAAAPMLALNPYSICYLEGTTVYCMGRNTYGQLGVGTKANNTASFAPVIAISGSSGLLSATALTASAGTYSNYEHFCAATSAGGIACWGYNGHGNLGNANTTDSSTPVGVFQ